MLEKVSDYPRPPRLESVKGSVEIVLKDDLIVSSTKYIRILETYHPPSIYIPISSFRSVILTVSAKRQTSCEWKGIATYLDINSHSKSFSVVGAGWTYQKPRKNYASLSGYVAIYSNLVDEAWLDGERVSNQLGGFYGGWITSSIQGPFKGDPSHPELI